jgi:hypothetical protein
MGEWVWIYAFPRWYNLMRFLECVVIIRTIYTNSFLYTNSDVSFDTITGIGLGLAVISGHDVDPHDDV